MFIFIKLFTDTFDIVNINLTNIIKVSQTSTWLSINKIKGIPLQTNVVRQHNWIINNKNNLNYFYELHKKELKEKWLTQILTRIIDETNNIKPTHVDNVKLTKYEIEKLIETHYSLNEHILNKIEKDLVYNKFIKWKEKQILEAFSKDFASKTIWSRIEEIICGKDTKNNFEDLLIELDDNNIYINIKSTDLLIAKNSSSAEYNVNKLFNVEL